ncbi:MAG: hypothetical protein JW774_12370 [Candidatus Aureabacteria bacterium]|nr:hypothetical protein [Candidatus Auribacterota bacterium]
MSEVLLKLIGFAARMVLRGFIKRKPGHPFTVSDFDIKKYASGPDGIKVQGIFTLKNNLRIRNRASEFDFKIDHSSSRYIWIGSVLDELSPQQKKQFIFRATDSQNHDDKEHHYEIAFKDPFGRVYHSEHQSTGTGSIRSV